MKHLFIPLSAETSANKLIAFWIWIILGSAIWFISSFNSFIPTPAEVLSSWVFLVQQEALLYELYISFVTNLQAIIITTILSLFISYVIVLPIMKPFVNFCSKSRFFGITGFVVLFTLVFGGGHWLKVSLLTFGMSVFFITSMASVITEISQTEFDYARTLRFSNWQIVWEVIIRGKLDQALEILRQNAAYGWVMLTMVEGLNRSEGGLGALMLNENKHFKLAAVFAIQITILILGIIQDAGIKYFRQLVCPYSCLENK